MIALGHGQAFLRETEDGHVLVRFEIHQHVGFYKHGRPRRGLVVLCQRTFVPLVLVGFGIAACLRIADVAGGLRERRGGRARQQEKKDHRSLHL